jgi:hypothetical protein
MAMIVNGNDCQCPVSTLESRLGPVRVVVVVRGLKHGDTVTCHTNFIYQPVCTKVNLLPVWEAR